MTLISATAVGDRLGDGGSNDEYDAEGLVKNAGVETDPMLGISGAEVLEWDNNGDVFGTDESVPFRRKLRQA
ncbi:MAG TPA: hypothetical protein VFZ27_04690 [Terriglobia bacterium]|nr:hypothetical protein [Terriglobia bacterium]